MEKVVMSKGHQEKPRMWDIPNQHTVLLRVEMCV